MLGPPECTVGGASGVGLMADQGATRGDPSEAYPVGSSLNLGRVGPETSYEGPNRVKGPTCYSDVLAYE